ncbi:maleylpyruvate isomerase family mycothiol-dependent enzyme [Streptomyces sp. NRRL S-118]|uniref:maleylpyruvate isomerase family mycothiol-dependent enzyme n=1 Tax=Streptomyces sp. NRRL S-118 TaxID=1463881 RepID=UPI000B1EEA18|nr:maleylpyruvate isomerase family mycothiol-dependent enzyme [Streptomyces sp. NRRL S-118]
MEKATSRKGRNAEVTAWIAAERHEPADLLDGPRDDQWDDPSLCAGWWVREVAAHMPLGFRLSLPATLGEPARARGNLHGMTDRGARRDAAVHFTAELAAFLREGAPHYPWTSPVGGYTAALGHDVVHGLDITVALGLDRRVPQGAAARAARRDSAQSGLRFSRRHRRSAAVR